MTIDLRAFIKSLSPKEVLTLVELICENLPDGVTIRDIRGVVNCPAFDEVKAPTKSGGFDLGEHIKQTAIAMMNAQAAAVRNAP